MLVNDRLDAGLYFRGTLCSRWPLIWANVTRKELPGAQGLATASHASGWAASVTGYGSGHSWEARLSVGRRCSKATGRAKLIVCGGPLAAKAHSSDNSVLR